MIERKTKERKKETMKDFLGAEHRMQVWGRWGSGLWKEPSGSGLIDEPEQVSDVRTGRQ